MTVKNRLQTMGPLRITPMDHLNHRHHHHSTLVAAAAVMIALLIPAARWRKTEITMIQR